VASTENETDLMFHAELEGCPAKGGKAHACFTSATARNEIITPRMSENHSVPLHFATSIQPGSVKKTACFAALEAQKTPVMFAHQRGFLLNVFGNTTGRFVMGLPVIIRKAGNRHAFYFRRMDKLIIPDINANVPR